MGRVRQVQVSGAFGSWIGPKRGTRRDRHPAIEDEDDARLRALADALCAQYSYDEIEQIAESVRHELHRRAEIEAMFRRLSRMPPWSAIEQAVHVKLQVWAAYGLHWRKTPEGRAYFRNYQRERVKKLRAKVVGTMRCKGCGKPMPRTAEYDQRGRATGVCSVSCRGRARANIELVTIGGVSLPLVEWSRRAGLELKTVCQRIARGWDVERALRTPPANRGQQKERRRAAGGVHADR